MSGSLGRPISLGDIAREVDHLLRSLVEAELFHEADEVIGEGLTLNQGRDHGSAAFVNEGGLLNQEAVKVIQEEPGPGRQVDQAAALRGEVGPASEGSDQFTLEGHCLPSASHSAIKGMESPELYPDHRGSQAVAGAGLSGLHDGSIDL